VELAGQRHRQRGVRWSSWRIPMRHATFELTPAAVATCGDCACLFLHYSSFRIVAQWQRCASRVIPVGTRVVSPPVSSDAHSDAVSAGMSKGRQAKRTKKKSPSEHASSFHCVPPNG